MDQNGNNSNQFEVREPAYLDTFECFDNEESFDKIKETIEKLKKKNNLLICDSMCGTGKVGKWMLNNLEKDKIKKVVFTDASKKMLDSIDSDSEKVLAYGNKMPFEDCYFDVIVCRYGFNNVERKLYPDIMKEHLRILKDDGILIIHDASVDNENDKNLINKIELFFVKIDGRNDNPYIPTIDEFENIINDSGGIIIDKKSFTYVYSVNHRIKTKGLGDIDLEELKQILNNNKSSIEFEIKDDDIIIKVPIKNITVKKS
ncbi:class I SAM-dependent methyltransferase [Candidatus Aenigmatarchaeota archaeon]